MSDTELKAPKQYKGWTLNFSKKKYIRIYKNIKGIQFIHYIGKNWYPELADRLIEKTEFELEYNKHGLKYELKQESMPINYENIPKEYKGWTVNFYQKGKYIRLYKSFNNCVVMHYIGKDWNTAVADRIIKKYVHTRTD